MIFDAWRFEKKRYVIVENGTPGKSTGINAEHTIIEWLDERKQ